ncbi:MAG: hypothetical protein V3T22_08835 [Planctomycetota bacterium]
MIHESAYLEWGVSSTAPFVRDWLGDEALRADWNAEFHELVHDHLESPEVIANYAAHCPCPGAEHADYMPRDVDLGDGLTVFAGIHFGQSFFVHVYAQTRPLLPSELSGAANTLLETFSVFEPTTVRWWEAAQTDSVFPGEREEDLRLIVGHLPTILADGTPPDPRVRLVRSSSVPFYDEYTAMYERFLTDHPMMRPLLSVEEREDLQGCADVGALFRVLVEDEFAGVIAANPTTYRGVGAWSVREELLDTPYRGRGLAKLVQRSMLARLDQTVSPLVLGTIYTANQPSLRTALSVGRRDAGGWVTLGGPPF